MRFDFDSETRRRVGHRLIELVDQYYSSLPDRPVQLPVGQRIFGTLNNPLPENGADPLVVLEEVFAEMVAKRFAGMPTVIPDANAPRVVAVALPDERIPRAREIAAEDGRRAVDIVRERAAEWGIDPHRIGMVGFSAGAFLVTDLAMDPRGAPLAFIAPIYGGETQGRAVSADAPPLFTAVAQDDRMFFRVVEGLYTDWSSADRPAELHIFTRGGHGFGVAKRGLPVDRWTDLLGDWLGDQGFA